MQLSLFLFAVLTFITMGLAQNDEVFRPYRIGYEALMNGANFETSSGVRTSLIDALSNVGIVSVTDIPFASKKQALTSIHECAMASAAALKHTFQDGTVRTTMATHTIPGGVQTIEHNTPACDKFSKASDDFRQTIAEVTQAFGLRLNEILQIEDKDIPTLATMQGHPFTTISDVVENGEHLEHFHSYQRTSETTEETISIHTDQGLFIAFTPALLVDTTQDSSLDMKTSVSDGFFVELQDGSRVMADFDEKDDLVFMLGDGVNQIINSKLSSKSSSIVLRATPHAVTMPTISDEHARVWYGRMVLPPMDAVHPQHGITYEEVRRGLVEGAEGGEALSLGCSHDLQARSLQEDNSCVNNTIYCWSRCMNATEYVVSDDICAEKGLDMRCINPRNQLYVEGHGDFYPACIDAANSVKVTSYPPIDNSTRLEETCTEDAFETFAMIEEYSHHVMLGNGLFSWTVVDGMLDARLSYDGNLGWLAFGFADLEGYLNGMLGASIIMGLPGGNYDPATGLDLTVGNNIHEYVIEGGSAFRHWSTPTKSIERAATQHSIETSDCFSAISFKTDNINGIKFDFEGTDELLWGGNNDDYFVGYHGREDRLRFAIEWSTGIVTDRTGFDDGELYVPAIIASAATNLAVSSIFAMAVSYMMTMIM